MNVNVYEKTLESVLGEINHLIRSFHLDMVSFSEMPISEMFYFLSRYIRYIPDPETIELVMRPKILIQRRGGDCDDKTIAACSFFVCKNISNGYSIVSEDAQNQYHHIFAFFIINNKKYDFDCTYASSKYLARRDWVRRKDFLIYDDGVFHV